MFADILADIVFAQLSGRSKSRLWGLVIIIAVVGLLYLMGRAKTGSLATFRPYGSGIVMTLPLAAPAAEATIARFAANQRSLRIDDRAKAELLFSDPVNWYHLILIEEEDDKTSKWRVERQAKFGWMDSVMSRQARMGLENFERKLRMAVKGSVPSP